MNKTYANTSGVDELAGLQTRHPRSLLPRNLPEALAELTPGFHFRQDELRSRRTSTSRLAGLHKRCSKTNSLDKGA